VLRCPAPPSNGANGTLKLYRFAEFNVISTDGDLCNPALAQPRFLNRFLTEELCPV
jgi:hypothetical protein